ncbi:uncharacterized protein LOC114324050 [Camellia sinensis]|uniref:Uncharacterized protein n=1 Tax=Camellia sinensis TaxID=4442 RepID=A0A7J7HBA7_CAMSI|nr:uncharacterized protein LOC114324050 [Camellia sinensis]KAF5949108.1 hypothetical protein HYC85_015065 [Camellia sinensis]
MAKNRNKKKRNDSTAMDIASDQTVLDLPQAMDTSESAAPKAPLGTSTIKLKRGVQMKRSKNVRKMKAMAKAVSKNEKSLEKILKQESKTSRTQSAKKLYD